MSLLKVDLFRGLADEIMRNSITSKNGMEWSEFKFVKIKFKARLAETHVNIENFVNKKMREYKKRAEAEDAKFFA